jgi:uncharacterized protein YcbX
MTFVSLALLAISATQADWLAVFFGSPVTVIPVNDEAYVAIRWNLGNTVLVLLSLGLAYLWLSSDNSN